LRDLLNVIVVGSRGSQKDFEELSKSLVPPEVYAKPITKEAVKDLKKKYQKRKQ